MLQPRQQVACRLLEPEDGALDVGRALPGLGDLDRANHAFGSLLVDAQVQTPDVKAMVVPLGHEPVDDGGIVLRDGLDDRVLQHDRRKVAVEESLVLLLAGILLVGLAVGRSDRNDGAPLARGPGRIPPGHRDSGRFVEGIDGDFLAEGPSVLGVEFRPFKRPGQHRRLRRVGGDRIAQRLADERQQYQADSNGFQVHVGSLPNVRSQCIVYYNTITVKSSHSPGIRPLLSKAPTRLTRVALPQPCLHGTCRADNR